jgi:hypothetical protein
LFGFGCFFLFFVFVFFWARKDLHIIFLDAERGENHINGVNLAPEGILFCTDSGREGLDFIGADQGDAAHLVHHRDELGVQVSATFGEVILESLIFGLIHYVAVTGSRKREGDVAEAAVAWKRGVDRRWHQDRLHIRNAGTEGAEAGGSRRREEITIDLQSPSVTTLDELKIDFGFGIKRAAAVKAEARRIFAVKARIAVQAALGIAIPDLDVAVAEEVHLRYGTTRDAADKTRRFACGAVVDDLLSGDGGRHSEDWKREKRVPNAAPVLRSIFQGIQ